MLRVGLAGCGFIGTVHSFALQGLIDAELVDAKVTAIFDRDPGRASGAAGMHGADIASDLRALVESVDVVWTCVPTAAHLEVVGAAADAGRAVFCEKPLGRNLAEAEAVAAQLARIPHRTGLVLRSAPVFVALHDELAGGRHGRPMAAVFRDDQWFPIGGIYGSTWRADVGQAGAGTLLEHSIHDLDLLRWLLGDPTAVSARVGNFAGHDGVEDLAAVQLTFADDVVASLVSIWHRVASRPSTRRLEVFCEDALLWLDDDNLGLDDDNLGPLHVETSDGAKVREPVVPPWTDAFDLPPEYAKPLVLYATQAKEFLDDLATGAACRGPDASVALAAHRLVDAAYRSAHQDGAPVLS